MGFPTGGMTVKISVAWWQTRQVGNQEPYVSMQSCELELFPHACKVSRSCHDSMMTGNCLEVTLAAQVPVQPAIPSPLVLETVLAVESCCCYWSASALAPRSLNFIFFSCPAFDIFIFSSLLRMWIPDDVCIAGTCLQHAAQPWTGAKCICHQHVAGTGGYFANVRAKKYRGPAESDIVAAECRNGRFVYPFFLCPLSIVQANTNSKLTHLLIKLYMNTWAFCVLSCHYMSCPQKQWLTRA